MRAICTSLEDTDRALRNAHKKAGALDAITARVREENMRDCAPCSPAATSRRRYGAPSPTLSDLNSRPGFTRRNPSMETHAQCGFADSDRFGAVFLPPRPDAPVPRLPPSPMGHGPARHGARPSTRSGKVPGASARWPRLWRTPVGVLYSHPGSSHWWTVVIAPGRLEGGRRRGWSDGGF
ncbi:hypothetical protein T492DRAFT_1143790 [Pavlovales sp. CCMP2436]|nr:hypothetical protein T492DRAFT_1143790 [Pavlovales sp. CCMP2436]